MQLQDACFSLMACRYVSNDPYFYITRDDILQLLKTKDDQMIQHMLKNEIMLHIKEDMSYKLVKIKGG